jgi:hypothetical protein
VNTNNKTTTNKSTARSTGRTNERLIIPVYTHKSYKKQKHCQKGLLRLRPLLCCELLSMGRIIRHMGSYYRPNDSHNIEKSSEGEKGGGRLTQHSAYRRKGGDIYNKNNENIMSWCIFLPITVNKNHVRCEVLMEVIMKF